MSEFYGRKINEIQLHEGLFIKGFGNIEKSLPSQSKSLDTEMSYAKEGVFVKMKTRTAFAYTEFLVPWTMVKSALFAPVEAK